MEEFQLKNTAVPVSKHEGTHARTYTHDISMYSFYARFESTYHKTG
jgi:hypothetical protein